MPLTTAQWHARFLEQSAWTAPLRAFLFNQAKIQKAHKVLEVGCGTGAITQSLPKTADLKVFGLDILFDRVNYAHQLNAETRYLCTDALALPLPPAVFDITFCHFFFLWMNDQVEIAIDEMIRVTRPGGFILALAEPDYVGRVDFPQELIALGKLQTQSLVDQGAIPNMGRQLPGLFSQAGLRDIQFGQSGFQNTVGKLPTWLDSEWETLYSDLQLKMSEKQFLRLKEIDRQAWINGSRVLYIPTFYALGTVP